MSYIIRPAVDQDMEALLVMMQAHALFEGHKLTLAREKINRKFADIPASIFIVVIDHKTVGYMSVVKQFSTWDMDWYLYLDCLYLTDETRGLGIGTLLMQKLNVLAKEQGVCTIQWQTPIDNFPAINFYQKLGAITKEKQRFHWLVD